jgi:hypothetical protein
MTRGAEQDRYDILDITRMNELSIDRFMGRGIVNADSVAVQIALWLSFRADFGTDHS